MNNLMIARRGMMRQKSSNASVFTVNRSGKKVEFAPGNLYWNNIAYMYKFEDNDYDFPTAWSSSHLAHFFWSKDANVARAQEYSDDSASTADKFFASDGGVFEGWTVLSKDEWDYVIANHLGKTDVYIDEKPCTVLTPDGVSASVVANSYTAAAWADAKAQYGLVALPYAGERYSERGTGMANAGRLLHSAGIYGTYWSSSPYLTGSDATIRAYCASIEGPRPSTSSNLRYSGCSVRLVKEI